MYAYFHQYWTDSRLAGKLNRTITIKLNEVTSKTFGSQIPTAITRVNQT